MDYQTIYIQVYCSLLQAFYNPQQSNKTLPSAPTLMAQEVNPSNKYLTEIDERIIELADLHTRQILKHIQDK